MGKPHAIFRLLAHLSPVLALRMLLEPYVASIEIVKETWKKVEAERGVVVIFGSIVWSLYRIVLALTIVAPGHWYRRMMLDSGDEVGWEKIHPKLLPAIDDHYDVDLEQVRFVRNVDTFQGACVTLDSDIYLDYAFEWGRKEDVHLMLHELQHVVQFSQQDYEPFLVAYFLNGIWVALTHWTLDPHDLMLMEIDAETKADTVFATLKRSDFPPKEKKKGTSRRVRRHSNVPSKTRKKK